MSKSGGAQFTPGPWAVEPRQWDHGASLAIVAPHSGYIVAVVPFDEDIQTVDEPDYETVKRHPDEVPNAHLIAAAPAMYTTGKLSVDVMARVARELERLGNEPLRALLRSAIIEQEAALAQAEGREG